MAIRLEIHQKRNMNIGVYIYSEYTNSLTCQLYFGHAS